MNCNTPGFPVFLYLLKPAQTHVHWVDDAIQPSYTFAVLWSLVHFMMWASKYAFYRWRKRDSKNSGNSPDITQVESNITETWDLLWNPSSFHISPMISHILNHPLFFLHSLLAFTKKRCSLQADTPEIISTSLVTLSRWKENRSVSPDQVRTMKVNPRASVVLGAQATLRSQDCSPPGSSVCGICQTKTVQWVASLFSRGSSWPRDQTWVSCIAGKFFTG